jgi:hypothetical protein
LGSPLARLSSSARIRMQESLWDAGSQQGRGVELRFAHLLSLCEIRLRGGGVISAKLQNGLSAGHRPAAADLADVPIPAGDEHC